MFVNISGGQLSGWVLE